MMVRLVRTSWLYSRYGCRRCCNARKKGSIWAMVIKLWLNEFEGHHGTVRDKLLDKYVMDAVGNMLDDKKRLRAMRVSGEPSGRF